MLTIRDISHRFAAACALVTLLSCGGDEGGGSTEPTPNPTPTVTAISRDTATAGASTFSVVLGGADFLPGVVATFDGFPRTTNRLSGGAISFALLAGDLSAVGDHEIRAKNPDPTAGPSAPITFHVLAPPPVPVIDSLSPDTVSAGGSAFTLNVHGTGFTLRSVIRWNSIPLTTVRHGTTHLSASIAASDIASPGSMGITVLTPTPGGGTSASRTLAIIAPPPPPTITGVDPDTIVAEFDTIPFTIHGTGLGGVDSVFYNYQGVTRYVLATSSNDSTVVAPLDRSWFGSIGLLAVRVRTAQGWTQSKFVETMDPVPVIDSVSPDTLDGLVAADTFVIHGRKFKAGLAVFIGESQIADITLFGHDSIRAIVDAGHLYLGGIRGVRVREGGDFQYSTPHDVAIVSPVPVLDSMAPTTDTVASNAQHTLYGSNFRGNGVVLVNGVPRAPTFINAVSATFPMLPTDAPAPGTVSVQYQTPGPGGGTTAAQTLTILATNPVPTVDSIIPGVVRSDSGTQTVTLHGHGFMAGTVVEAQLGDPDFGGIDTFPILSLADSAVTVEVPASRLIAGARLYIGARAPEPTAGTSPRTLVPVWTTGVRDVRFLAGPMSVWWATDTVRQVIYASTNDFDVTSLLERDPTTGATIRSLALPDGGARLVIDDEARYLYAISGGGLNISRVDLAAWHLDWTVTLPAITPYVVFVAPQSAHPGTFVAGGNNTGNEYANRVWVFDGPVLRTPVDTFFSGVHTARFFGDSLVMTNIYNVYRRTVTPGAVTPLDSVPFQAIVGGPGTILRRDRLVGGGHLMDLVDGSVVASGVQFSNPGLMDGDTTRFFVGTGVTTVGRFDMATGALSRAVTFHVPPNVSPRTFGLSSTGMFFLGMDNPSAAVIDSDLTDP